MSEDQKQEECQVVVRKEDRTPMTTGGQISAIIPKDHVEAFRFAEAFLAAGMIPASYSIKKNAHGKEVKEWEDGVIDQAATRARVAIGIMKGMEIGLPPVTALSTICVINNRPCVWGDGAVALVQKSGKLEWVKDGHEGSWDAGNYVHHFTVKRKDQAEPITRSFSIVDAKAANLFGKKGPWASGYGPRMCFNRARAWALRDAFSDVLLGIGIAEEVRDIPDETPQDNKPDISSLEDGPVAMLAAPEEKVAEQKEPEFDPDWLSVIDQLKPALKRCENQAALQLFWVDEAKAIGSLDRAPENIKFMWQSLISQQQAKFKKGA
jgi:hypothetical protein